MTEPEKNPRSDGTPETSPEPPAAPNLHKSAPPNLDKSGPPDLGRTFDYDATAEASLSEPPATSEIGPVTGATGSGSGTGPGWDVHAGVGNGPGWGETPSYPPPNSGYGEGPVYGPPDPTYQQYEPHQGQQGYPPPYQGQQGYPPPGPYPAQYPSGPYSYGVDPTAPYGRHPMTGEPLSDRSKLTGGLLGILLGAFGAGRFYLGQPGMAVAQIAVTWLTCGIGGIWPLIDGVMMLTGNIRDKYGRPLRD